MKTGILFLMVVFNNEKVDLHGGERTFLQNLAFMWAFRPITVLGQSEILSLN